MLLAQHFLGVESRALTAGRVSFSADAVAAMTAHDWPGNVRELQNRIRRAIAMLGSQWITAEDLGLEAGNADLGADGGEEAFCTLQEAREKAERKCIRQALLMTGNNISQAAKLLGTSRPTVHDLMKKHGITI